MRKICLAVDSFACILGNRCISVLATVDLSCSMTFACFVLNILIIRSTLAETAEKVRSPETHRPGVGYRRPSNPRSGYPV